MPSPTFRACNAAAREAATALGLLTRYYMRILPRARHELRRWERRASTIPDPTLREQALETLRGELMNAEAAAVFAALVPRARQPLLVRALVAFQVMYDYLDTISEQPVREPLRNGLQLHRALTVALDPSEPSADYYRHHPQREDGGYLDELVATCRSSLERLPAIAVVRPMAKRAARRCAEGQSHTHAAIHSDATELAAWALRQDRAAGYSWWEVAAGTISSVGVEALMAAAADTHTTPDEAARVDVAYFPPMCALSTLLDSFVDQTTDLTDANVNYFGWYRTSADAAEALARIAGRAADDVRRLRHARRHAAILAGIAAYYLTAEGAATDEAGPVADAIARRLGPVVAIVHATMRLHRRLGARSGR